MLSNNLLKQFASLKVKKFRQKYSQFVIEGEKSIKDLKNTPFSPVSLLFREDLDREITALFPRAAVYSNCAERLNKISSFETPSDTIAIANIPKHSLKFTDIQQGCSLFLDEIQDPGNLGTIIRIAAWYGFGNIALSKGCADVFNPKTIQASMGGFAKTTFTYTDKETWLQQARQTGIPVLGTFLEGENVHHFPFPQTCIIVIGNEGSGISAEVLPYITQKITICGSGQTESLNAAMATAIVLDNLFRTATPA